MLEFAYQLAKCILQALEKENILLQESVHNFLLFESLGSTTKN